MSQMNKLRRLLFSLLFLQILGVSAGRFAIHASPPENAFHVYLVDDRTGRPVEKALGVYVTLLRALKTGVIQPEERGLQLRFDSEPLGGGVYRFEDIEDGRYAIWVRAEGYAFQVLPVTLQGPASRREVIRMTPPGFVRGMVVDSAGNPVPDAGVAIRYIDDEYLSLQLHISCCFTHGGSARTNEFGEYFIGDYVRPGWRFVVEAGSDDFLPALGQEGVVEEGQVATLDVVLTKRAYSVRGHLLDDQEPVEGVRVHLHSLEEKPVLELSDGRIVDFRDPLFTIIATALSSRFTRISFPSAADGSFSIPGMPPGIYRITVPFSKAHEKYRGQVEVAEDGNNFFELVLTRKSQN